MVLRGGSGEPPRKRDKKEEARRVLKRFLRGGSPHPPRSESQFLAGEDVVPRVKHYFEKGHFYHLTTRTLDAVPAFASDAAKRKVVDALVFYRQRGDWRVHGFVVMSNHVHGVVSQVSRGLNDVIRDFKKWVFRRLKGAGGGKLWERRYDDNAIGSVREMTDVVEYVHNNPVRIGLVRRPEDCFWSSARNYAGLKPVAMEIDTEW
jgi:REP element-mobilizing transposase RayT